MIFYLTRADHEDTMAYVNCWGPQPGSRMRFMPYETLAGAKAVVPGAYIFADLEALTPGQLRLAAEFYQQLTLPDRKLPTLNDPRKVLPRLQLLQRLYESGINQFRAFRGTDALDSVRYPAFVRREDDHQGPVTPLLHSRSELRRQLLCLQVKGHRLRDLMVVEYCHSADANGVFRKYSAFIIGERILPRHLLFGKNWVLKQPEMKSTDMETETRTYLESNPHEGYLREIFRLANIEYGRIDYGIAGGALQVWEINTHPTIHSVTPRLSDAFECVDLHGNDGGTLSVHFSAGTVRRIERDVRKRNRGERLRKALSSIGQKKIILLLKLVLKTRLIPRSSPGG